MFADRRWNCSSLDAVPRRAPRELTRGTREQAAVHALASASLVRAVARACAAGVLPHCQCGALPRHPPDGHFQWGGCSDDVRYAKRWAKTFTDAPHKKLLARRPLPPGTTSPTSPSPCSPTWVKLPTQGSNDPPIGGWPTMKTNLIDRVPQLKSNYPLGGQTTHR